MPLLDLSRSLSAKSLLTPLPTPSASFGAILDALFFSILSLIFFFLYSSNSKGFATLFTFAYRPESMKKPCM